MNAKRLWPLFEETGGNVFTGNKHRRDLIRKTIRRSESQDPCGVSGSAGIQAEGRMDGNNLTVMSRYARPSSESDSRTLDSGIHKHEREYFNQRI